MRAYLVRIGVDQTYGGWNAPMNPETNQFVYVPIPESRAMQAKLATPYAWVQPALAQFEKRHPAAAPQEVRLPGSLTHANMHLHPDFQRLTYGDSGTHRGKGLVEISSGDVVVFYSGLKPVSACAHRLVYALVGLYLVAASVRARCIPIGAFRERAYRVEPGILTDWGGLSCKNGYIQRSAVLPTLTDPHRFMRWFERQAPRLVVSNNP